MLLGEIRQEIVRVCRELSAAGLVVGTAGNVSVRSGDLLAVTPSGLDYSAMSADLVGVHRLDGLPVEAPLEPTSELPLHLAVYANTDAAAVVHTHSVAATAVSTLADELPAIHYYVAMFGGPVRVSRYARYGTDQLARNVVAALVDSRRPGIADALDLGVKAGGIPALAVSLPDRERDAERARDTKGRGAADGQPGDRVDQFVHRGDVQQAELVWQRGLVYRDDVPIPPGDHVVQRVALPWITSHSVEPTHHR